jgi:hypothetical protein
MPKSTTLNFTQNVNTVYAELFSSDLLRVMTVSTNSAGTTGTAGTTTYTAAGGTRPTGANTESTWTATVRGVGANFLVVGQPTITNFGEYVGTGPTATGQTASASPASNATWNVRSEIYKDLYTASANDAVVKAINVSSLDSAARVMSLWIVGSDNQPLLLCSVNIPALSGNGAAGATPAVDLLNGVLLPSLIYDANGKRIIPLKAGQKLGVSVPAVTVGTQINVVATVEEY